MGLSPQNQLILINEILYSIIFYQYESIKIEYFEIGPKIGRGGTQIFFIDVQWYMGQFYNMIFKYSQKTE